MAGNTVARYVYDAWGKCSIAEDTTTVGIASINPYRYRSYYYDTETELYYLQSRYYDPETGRFINGDEVKMAVRQSLPHTSNLYSYCDNDPVNKNDLQGFSGLSIAVLVIIGAGIAKGLIDLYATVKTKQFKNSVGGGQFMQAWVAFLLGFFKGAGGMLFILLNGVMEEAVFSGIGAFASAILENIKNFAHGKKVSKKAFVKIFTDGFLGDPLNNVLFDIPIKKIVSYIKAGKLTSVAQRLAEKFLKKKVVIF